MDLELLLSALAGAKAGYKPPVSASAPDDEHFGIDLDMGEQFEECLEMTPSFHSKY